MSNAQFEELLDAVEASSDVQRLVSKVKPKDTYGVLSIPDSCSMQAFFNKTHVYRDLDLRIVVGSLGIGKKDPWFEYGSKDFKTVKDFMTSKFTKKNGGGNTQVDMHCWLEDSKGSVYDTVTSQVSVNVKIVHKKTTKYKTNDVIEAVSKEELALKGLHYVPSDPMCSAVLIKMIQSERELAYREENMRAMREVALRTKSL
jgi:hypothetical protein